MEKKNYYQRVVDEMELYPDAFSAAIDHLSMADSHLFEEMEGRDLDGIRSDILNVIMKIKNLNR